jgi:hypothetical protein
MSLERLRTCTHKVVCARNWAYTRPRFADGAAGGAGYEPVRAVAQRPVESLQQQNERLKRALAEKTLEVDFLLGALQQVEARRRQNTASGVRASTPKSEE